MSFNGLYAKFHDGAYGSVGVPFRDKLDDVLLPGG